MTENYHTVKVTTKLLKFWLENNQNVMLIGERGCGKTAVILEALTENNTKFMMFAGATMDPYTDLIGLPFVQEKDGEKVTQFILPENVDRNTEVFFVDEWNRADPKVTNALMELIQFKSINGIKFPKLKAVWAACNPPADVEEEDALHYAVEQIDAAQLDRFHVIVNVPYKPDLPYFKKKFGEKGENAIKWWNMQSQEAKLAVSPRRLDYAVNYHNLGGNITHALPKTCNSNKLIELLSSSKEELKIKDALDKPTKTNIKYIFKNIEVFNANLHVLFTKSKYTPFLDQCPQEFITQNINNINVNKFLLEQNNEEWVNSLVNDLENTPIKTDEISLFIKSYTNYKNNKYKVVIKEDLFLKKDITESDKGASLTKTTPFQIEEINTKLTSYIKTKWMLTIFRQLQEQTVSKELAYRYCNIIINIIKTSQSFTGNKMGCYQAIKRIHSLFPKEQLHNKCHKIIKTFHNKEENKTAFMYRPSYSNNTEKLNVIANIHRLQDKKIKVEDKSDSYCYIKELTNDYIISKGEHNILESMITEKPF